MLTVLGRNGMPRGHDVHRIVNPVDSLPKPGPAASVDDFPAEVATSLSPSRARRKCSFMCRANRRIILDRGSLFRVTKALDQEYFLTGRNYVCSNRLMQTNIPLIGLPSRAERLSMRGLHAAMLLLVTRHFV